MRTGYKGGFGNETSEVWGRQLHYLVSAHGSVEKFLKAFEPEFTTALKTDLALQARHSYRNLQHELPALTALATLDRLQTPDPHRITSREIRESNQTISEARLYESLAVLEKGSAVDGSIPTEQSNDVRSDH